MNSMFYPVAPRPNCRWLFAGWVTRGTTLCAVNPQISFNACRYAVNLPRGAGNTVQFIDGQWYSFQPSRTSPQVAVYSCRPPLPPTGGRRASFLAAPSNTNLAAAQAAAQVAQNSLGVASSVQDYQGIITQASQAVTSAAAAVQDAATQAQGTSAAGTVASYAAQIATIQQAVATDATNGNSAATVAAITPLAQDAVTQAASAISAATAALGAASGATPAAPVPAPAAPAPVVVTPPSGGASATVNVPASSSATPWLIGGAVVLGLAGIWYYERRRREEELGRTVRSAASAVARRYS